MEGIDWECGLEFQYASPESLYVRPPGAKKLVRKAILRLPPKKAEELDVVLVPPLSGIERDEPRRDRGMQDLLVGQGRPGDILRNLLCEIADNDDDNGGWSSLAADIKDLFGIELRKPRYSPLDPSIVCKYQERDHGRLLDLNNAGSGALQVLMLLAFM